MDAVAIAADVSRIYARSGGGWSPDPGTFELVTDDAGAPVAAIFEQDGQRLTVPWGAVESMEYGGMGTSTPT